MVIVVGKVIAGKEVSVLKAMTNNKKQQEGDMISDELKARINALPKEHARAFSGLLQLPGVEDKDILPALARAEQAGMQNKVDKLLDFVQQRGSALAQELGMNAGKATIFLGAHDDKLSQLQATLDAEVRAKATELGVVSGSVVYDIESGPKYQPVKKVGGGGGGKGAQPREGSATVSNGEEHSSEYQAAKAWGWMSGGVVAQFGAVKTTYHRRGYVAFKDAAEKYFEASGRKPVIVQELHEKA